MTCPGCTQVFINIIHKTFAVTFLGFLANYEKCNGVIVILSYYKHHFTLVILVCSLSSSGAEKKKNTLMTLTI